jgi:hypothetical protein
MRLCRCVVETEICMLQMRLLLGVTRFNSYFELRMIMQEVHFQGCRSFPDFLFEKKENNKVRRQSDAGVAEYEMTKIPVDKAV